MTAIGVRLATTPFPRLSAVTSARQIMALNGSRLFSAQRDADAKLLAQDGRFRDLMVAAQQGQRPAYETLLRECLPMIRRMARQHGAAPELLDDVVQDVLLTIHRARHTYDPSRPFTVWVSMIAHRRAVDSIRSRGRRLEHETHEPIDFETYAEPQASYDELGGQTIAKVQEAIRNLPEAQREAVNRLALKEQTLQEAARESGRSAGSLKVSLHRALKALRARLGAGEGP